MSMYLSNQDLRPTGYEPAEFIEVPPPAPAVDRNHATSELQVEVRSAR